MKTIERILKSLLVSLWLADPDAPAARFGQAGTIVHAGNHRPVIL
jgi:hypothetical protein